MSLTPVQPSPDWNLVEVRLRARYLNGKPARGSITAKPQLRRFLDDDTVNPFLIVGSEISDDFNKDGLAVLHLPATNDPDITPNGFTFTITENIVGSPVTSYEIEVPLEKQASGIELSRVQVISPSDGQIIWTKGLILHGDGPPGAMIGGISDYYIDDENHALYGPKTTHSGWGQPYLLASASEVLAARDRAEDAADLAVAISGIEDTDDAIDAALKIPGGKAASTIDVAIEDKAPDLGVPGKALVGQAKQIRGGIMPKPLRHPTLAVERMWPNLVDQVRIMWTSTDGQTVYGFDTDGWFLKSTNGGESWVPRGQIPLQGGGNVRGFGRGGTFLRLKDGVTMLSFRLQDVSGIPFRIARSTDEGATWADIDVTTLMASGLTATNGGGPMGPTAWCEDPVTGYVYYGEYDSSDTKAEVNVYRSTDKGATWAKFHTFPGPATSSPDRVRHIHAVEWDHISQRIVIMTGDPEPAAGIYRVNAAGTGVEPWLLNRQITNLSVLGFEGTPYNQSARAIGFMPFPDYIAYAADSALRAIVRVPRSALTTDGSTNVEAEIVYHVNSTAWFAARASDDGSRWVVSASQEGTTNRIDGGTHLYSVEDQGATVYEIGVLPVTGTQFISLAPVSKADSGGDVFYLQTHGTLRWAIWRCQITQASGTQIPWPLREIQPDAFAWETVNWNVKDLAPGESVRFATMLTPQGARLLSIYDGAVKSFAGSLKLRVLLSVTEVWSTTERSARITAQAGPSGRRIASVPSAPGTELHVELTNTHASVAATGSGRFVFGWRSSW